MKLAEDSVEEHAGRVRAEAALESTSEELQRAARFSADASHQLKTPVAVLRAGLEELQAHGSLSAECQQEISALVNQTGRLSGVIDDLLLLSRLDAGRLKLKFGPVKLAQLIEAALDDLGAQPEAAELAVEVDVSADLLVTGDRQYLGLILQNLMENARKYNQPGGRIRLVARQERGNVVLTLGNTGKTIPPAAQTHIFERFHRGAMGENVPGYGLGLNLARELVRLHRGELRLVRSEAGWTEFELEFPAADSAGLEAAS
jgi:signal transduction histidine kinase